MSKQDYQASMKIEAEARSIVRGAGASSFYSLLMALIRVADSDNLAKIEAMWPLVVAELRLRYKATAGALSVEELAAGNTMSVELAEKWFGEFVNHLSTEEQEQLKKVVMAQ